MIGLTTNLVDKRFQFFIRLFLLIGLLFTLLSTTKLQAQVGTLELAGRAVKDGAPLPGAIVTVYRGGTIQQEQIKVGKNGKFKFFSGPFKFACGLPSLRRRSTSPLAILFRNP